MRQPTNVISTDPDYMLGWKNGQEVLVPKNGDGDIATYALDSTGAVTGLVGPGGGVGRGPTLSFDGAVNARDFYANGVSGPLVDPTGVLDSTLGIQAAVDALKAQGGGKLVFPPGTYKITNRIFIQGLNNAVITGPGATIFKSGFDYGPGSNPIFYFLECNFIQVEQLRFVGSQPSTSDVLYGDDGVLFVDCIETSIMHNEFTDFGDGATRNLSHFVTDPPISVIAFNVHIAFNFFNNILDPNNADVAAARAGSGQPDDAALLHLSHHYGMSQDSLRHLGDEAHHPER